MVGAVVLSRGTFLGVYQDGVAAEHVVVAGVNLADLVVPDDRLVGRLALLLTLIIYVGMEGEAVFGGGQVGHVGIEVVAHVHRRCRRGRPLGDRDCSAGRRLPLARPGDVGDVAVIFEVRRAT